MAVSRDGKYYATAFRDGRIVLFDYTVVLESELDSVAATLPDQHLPRPGHAVRQPLRDRCPAHGKPGVRLYHYGF